MKLLVEAKYIPDGTVVRKKTGTYTYTIRDNLKIFTYDTANGGKGSDGTRQVIAQEGMKCMVNTRGDINMVSGETLLCVDLAEIARDSDDDEAYDNYNFYLLEQILSARTGQDVHISAETSK